MDIDGKYKSSLGDESDLQNAEKDKVTVIKTSTLRKNDKQVTPAKRERQNA